MADRDCLDIHKIEPSEVVAIREALALFLKSIESADELDEIHVKIMQEISCQFAVRRQKLLSDSSPCRPDDLRKWWTI